MTHDDQCEQAGCSNPMPDDQYRYYDNLKTCPSCYDRLVAAYGEED